MSSSCCFIPSIRNDFLGTIKETTFTVVQVVRLMYVLKLLQKCVHFM